MLWHLLHWSALGYALLTFADNTCLLDVYFHRIMIYIHFPLIYAMWWALTHITRSYLCMNGWQRHTFSFNTHTHTHTHTLKRAWRPNEDINTRTMDCVSCLGLPTKGNTRLLFTCEKGYVATPVAWHQHRRRSTSQHKSRDTNAGGGGGGVCRNQGLKLTFLS